MTAYIFTGGQVFADKISDLGGSIESELCGEPKKLIIAADVGYLTSKRLGIKPDVLLGDLDSLGTSSLDSDELSELEKIIVPSVKDDTDTQLAIDVAIERSCDRIVIVGGMSGRIDHTLSTLFMLEYINRRGIDAIFTDGKNRVRLLSAYSELKSMKLERSFKYLSLISITDFCESVSISGVYYPLDKVKLTRAYSYAISNEITADMAEISLYDGKLLVIESRD